MSSEEIKILRRKLNKARGGGKLKEISDACCTLAPYLAGEGDHEEALKLYKESLTCCKELGDKIGEALAHRMIAEECINLGYFDEAMEHVIVFLNYAKSVGDKAEEQRGLVLEGRVYFTQAECLQEAKPGEKKIIEELLEQSLEAYRKSFALCASDLVDVSEKEKQQMKARLLQNKGAVFFRQNKLNYAQEHLIKAIKICSKEKLNETEHFCYLSLGEVYLKKGETQRALNVYNKALELSHSTQKKIDSLVGKAKTYIAMEDFQKAKSTFKQAYKIKSDKEVLTLLKNVSNVIQLENNICSTPDDKLLIRKDIYKKLGNSYLTLGNIKLSITCYLSMLSCAQKAQLSRNELIKCYSLLCKAFMKDKQYEKALFYSHQEIESLSKYAPSKAFKTYLRIAKLHELNNSEFEEINFAYSRAKLKAKELKNTKLQMKCLKGLQSNAISFDKPDVVSECEKEMEKLKQEYEEAKSSCDSESASGSDNDSQTTTEQSDTDTKYVISDSDVENEEYDRPKERCKRTKFTIKRNEKGETELHVAAIKGNYRRVKHLIDKGHPVNIRDTAGWTPLHEACNHGYVDIVNLLLDFGANINDKGGSSCDGITPLHDAAINGQLQVIDTLIKRGASTLVLNDAGQTPLQCLLSWKNNTALDADEDAMIENVIKSLKSPLDADDIKRHLKPLKRLKEKKAVTDYPETIRGKRNSRESLSGDSDEETKKVKKKICQEYKEVIEDLRFRNRKSKREEKKTKPIPALIDEDEYVENCIMDNDDEIEFVRSPVFKAKPVPKEPKTKPRSSREYEQIITVKTPTGCVRIPVKKTQKPTVSWLLEELADHRPEVKHPDNYVSIKVDDRHLERDDVVDGDAECVITKWKSLSLASRYKNLCTYPDTSSEVRAFKHTVHPQVYERLEQSSFSRTVTLSNLKLSSLNLIPISKAIMFESFLQCLDLSNNYFGDKGIELILKILNKCIIEELNLSGCNVTSTGVYLFSEALSDMNEFSKSGLEILNLSNNPITDDAITPINSIIDGLSNLRVLNVDSCELETEIVVMNSSGLVVIQENKFQNDRPSPGTDSLLSC